MTPQTFDSRVFYQIMAHLYECDIDVFDITHIGNNVFEMDVVVGSGFLCGHGGVFTYTVQDEDVKLLSKNITWIS